MFKTVTADPLETLEIVREESLENEVCLGVMTIFYLYFNCKYF